MLQALRAWIVKTHFSCTNVGRRHGYCGVNKTLQQDWKRRLTWCSASVNEGVFRRGQFIIKVKLGWSWRPKKRAHLCLRHLLPWRQNARWWETILTCALFPASPFLSRPPLPHPVQGRVSVQAWGASEAEARSLAPAFPLWRAAHRVFWFQQEEASSSWDPPFPRHCRESPSRRPFPRPSSPLLQPHLRPTGSHPSVHLLLLHLHLWWRQRCLSERRLFGAPDGLELFQLLVHYFTKKSRHLKYLVLVQREKHDLNEINPTPQKKKKKNSFIPIIMLIVAF